MEIIDNPVLSQGLIFKGGTCASMLGYLDRFSVDLDFDVSADADESNLLVEFHAVYTRLDFTIAWEHEKALLFQVKYPSTPGKRSTMKVSANSILVKANQHKVQYIPEIDRLMVCQTIETMFANKLVAVIDRYNAYITIAGRDIYDIHHFFIQGYTYHAPVIQERTGLTAKAYLGRLILFVRQHVTQKIINEDLNTLLPPDQYQQIRKILIPETLALLEREYDRLAG